MNVDPVGVERFHADGQRDMTKLTVAFLNFANVPDRRQSQRYKCNSR